MVELQVGVWSTCGRRKSEKFIKISAKQPQRRKNKQFSPHQKKREIRLAAAASRKFGGMEANQDCTIL